MSVPVPSELKYRQKDKILEVHYPDGQQAELSAHYLRVFSPSAEVRGHGGEWRFIPGKEQVAIRQIEPIGNYAVKLYFDDGHQTGIYTWEIFYDLYVNQAANWQRYLAASQQ